MFINSGIGGNEVWNNIVASRATKNWGSPTEIATIQFMFIASVIGENEDWKNEVASMASINWGSMTETTTMQGMFIDSSTGDSEVELRTTINWGSATEIATMQQGNWIIRVNHVLVYYVVRYKFLFSTALETSHQQYENQTIPHFWLPASRKHEICLRHCSEKHSSGASTKVELPMKSLWYT